MKSTIYTFAFCLLAVPILLLAQSSVDGRWAGELQGGRGPQPVTLTLKADSGKLTGSVQGGRGGEVTIEEGTISGDALKFKTKQMGRGGEVETKSTAKWDGSKLVISTTRPGQDGAPMTTTQTWSLEGGNLVIERTAQVLREDLRRVGIAMDVVALEPNQVIQHVVGGQFDAALVAFQLTDTDPGCNLDYWMSSGTNHFWNPGQTTPAAASPPASWS